MSGPASSNAQTPKLGPIPKAIAAVFAILLLVFGRTTGALMLCAFLGVPLFAIMGFVFSGFGGWLDRSVRVQR